MNSTLRVAAASLATGVIAVGSVLPAYAVGDGGQHAHQQSSARREGAERSAQASRHRAAEDGRRAAEQRDSKSQNGAGSEERSASGGGSSSHRASAPQPESSREAGAHGKADPPRHTPVTVCHLLGNGSYNVLTFDDSALKAHLRHGDLYPVPEDGCPVPEGAPATKQADGTTPETTQETTTTKETEQTTEVVRTELNREEVRRIEKQLLTQLGLPDTVLGVQLERSANRAPARVAPAQAEAAVTVAAPAQAAPAGGILPNTGAGPVGTALAAGLVLLAAGAGLLSRRRLHGTR